MDVENRLKEHNASASKGAKYTKTRRPVELVYTEVFETRSMAMIREAQVKRWKKDRKETLILVGK